MLRSRHDKRALQVRIKRSRASHTRLGRGQVACNFGFMNYSLDCTFHVAKAKALISCEVTALPEEFYRQRHQENMSVY